MLAPLVGVLLFLALANILISLVVLARDPHKFNLRVFSLLLISVGGWAFGIAGFFMVNGQVASIIWAKVFYAFPILIGRALAFFVQTFPSSSYKQIPRIIRYSLIFFALVNFIPLVAFQHYLTEGIRYHDWGKEVTLGRLAYGLYSAYIVIVFSGSLFAAYRRARLLGELYSKQVRLFFYSYLVASLFGVIFNLILPAAGNYRLIWLGPIFTSVLVVGVAFGIFKHRMFDIRLVVARTLAYSASVLVLLGAYALLFYVAIDGLSGSLDSSWGILVNLGLILIAATSFGPLKRYFDRISSRIFFRDAYDPQVFLDQLNSTLVNNIELEKLLNEAASVIADNIKASYCLFGIRETEFAGIRTFGARKEFSSEDIIAVRKLTPDLNISVIATDKLPPEQEQLKQILSANGVTLLVRLTSDPRERKEGIGYLVIGPKKSGNPYSSADERIIDIIAGELLIAIQNSLRFEEIQNFNKTLQRKITGATAELRRANERLQTLDETKDDFISMASHQLRTPLTSVKGYLSMVLEGDAGRISSTQRKMLQQAFISSQRMVFLIADLLNVSRLKTGKFVIEPVPTNLASLITEEIEQLQDTADARNLKLDYVEPKDFPELMLDETKTRQVIMNFIDNAIYYTNSGGKIEIRLEKTASAVEFRVVDNGIGVPASERHHLFTKFYRAKNAQKARPDGTGIGLFMAKKVIVGEGGSIIFDTEENKGSTFGFNFPLAKLAVKPASSEPANGPEAA